jgi:Putative Flp pilus-assembly TadE/G-like
MRALLKRRQDPRGERGAVLAITAIVMTLILVVAAFAIDEAIWFVHRQHLQTQADAAVLAAAHDFQYPCTPGGTMDQTIASAVHQYDGTTVASGGYNPLDPPGVAGISPVIPGPANPSLGAYSNTAHNLYSVINRPNFFNQSAPADTGLSGSVSVDGSPCSDAAIDSKLSETNLPSVFPFAGPSYINSQARISIENLTSASGAEPFVEPLPGRLPSSITATLVDESNNNSVVAGPVTLNNSSANLATFTGTMPSVTFPTVAAGSTGASHAIGLQLCYQGGACYEAGGGSQGVTYTRVWADVPSSNTTAPPQVGDVVVMPDPNGAPACTNPSGTANGTNFLSTPGSCTVVVVAKNVSFPTVATPKCSGGQANVALTLAVGGASPVNFPCPTGTPLNGQNWTSSPIAVNESTGLTNLTLGWVLTAGALPTGSSGGTNGQCGNGNGQNPSPCTGTLGVVQRINSGAFSTVDASTSNSGSIVGVALTDPNGNQIMSVQQGVTEASISISVNLLNFQDATSISSPVTALSFGGNQANAAIGCNGNSQGSPQFYQSIVTGCRDVYQSQPAPGTCPPPIQYSNPTSCAQENPGGGKLADDLASAMDCKINAGTFSGNKCQTSGQCVGFNHWVSPNSISDILASNDPRKVLLMITSNGALINGSAQVPIIAFATFYITGWSATPTGSEKSSDPCIGIAPNPTPPSGLPYTADDNPGANAPAGILLGHFVQYTVLPGNGTGSGTCFQGTFGDCIPVLTK